MCCIWAGYKKCDIKNTEGNSERKGIKYRGNPDFSSGWLDFMPWGFRVGLLERM